MLSFEETRKYVISCVLIFTAIIYVIGVNIMDNALQKSIKAESELTYFTDFELNGLDGERMTQDDLKEFKVTVVNGWAPWCGPCTSEMPSLDVLNNKYREKGLQIVGVVADYYGKDDPHYDEQIHSAIKSTGVAYPIFVSDKVFQDKAYITMRNLFPGTWAVDSEGNLIEFVSGARSEADWEAYFDKWLEGR